MQTTDTISRISLLNLKSGDTITTIRPQELSGLYSINTYAGHYRVVYAGKNYKTITLDTLLDKNTPADLITMNIILEKLEPPVVYQKMDLSKVPEVKTIDSAILIKGMRVADVGDTKVKDADILYYTVQVMALRKPVDVKYFKNINDMKVMYNDVDRFYRYTTGRFATREQALAWRDELIKRGYPKDIFIKKVTK